jgi:hypothetical protein
MLFSHRAFPQNKQRGKFTVYQKKPDYKNYKISNSHSRVYPIQLAEERSLYGSQLSRNRRSIFAYAQSSPYRKMMMIFSPS